MPQSDPPANDTDDTDDDKPANPLEAIRRAQANRSLPPGSGNRTAGRGGGKGSTPKAPRMYNRHK
ncbi:hypothetical protein [Dactylosporangium sp. CA-092794]|uniref:hypothetical protein n=1 Tax=Dactylosporangium sp. CA-092794 TaxID=3239929 RepID=UPI003D8AECAF